MLFKVLHVTIFHYKKLNYHKESLRFTTFLQFHTWRTKKPHTKCKKSFMKHNSIIIFHQNQAYRPISKKNPKNNHKINIKSKHKFWLNEIDSMRTKHKFCYLFYISFSISNLFFYWNCGFFSTLFMHFLCNVLAAGRIKLLWKRHFILCSYKFVWNRWSKTNSLFLFLLFLQLSSLWIAYKM